MLRNRLGITDPDELAAVEAALTGSRLVDLERQRLSGDYDLAHLQAFHRYIFADVYEWAGELRTVAIAKGGLRCLPQHLQSYGMEVSSKLAAAAYLRGLARERFVARLTEFFGDVFASSRRPRGFPAASWPPTGIPAAQRSTSWTNRPNSPSANPVRRESSVALGDALVAATALETGRTAASRNHRQSSLVLALHMASPHELRPTR